MSAGAIAKLMREAESQTSDAAPRSGIRPSWPAIERKDDAMPVLGFDEEPLEPTVVNNLASGFDAVNVSARPQTSASLVDAIVDEMVTLEDGDLEVQSPSCPPPLPARALSRPPKSDASAIPPTNSRWQRPRRAAFPECIERMAEPAVRDRRRRDLLIAAGGAVAVLALLVWWLCSG
jgi:hypothetical protein